MTPTITREARDWLLSQVDPLSLHGYGIHELIKSMPLTPSSDLDAVRARWQSKTRGGQAVKIVAAESACIFGLADNIGCVWRVSDGLNCDSYSSDDYHLVKASPHAALIAELRAWRTDCTGECVHGAQTLLNRAADALEKQP